MADPIVVSLFAGAGGLSLGFAGAGLRPRLAAELDDDAVATYRTNVSPDVMSVDIGAKPGDVIQAIERRSGAQPIFAVIGGPPCQGFSTAGSRDHGDPRNRLVFSYLDIVERLRPSWFLFENVEGILTSGGGEAVVGLAARFSALGYTFRVDKVNFARWGVPQARKRVLIVGNRHGLRMELPEATHAFEGKKHRGRKGQEQVTLGEAIVGLPAAPAPSHRMAVAYASPAPLSAFDARMRTAPPGPKGHAVATHDRDAERIRLLKPGQSLRDLPEDMWPESFRSRAFRRVADGMPTERRGGAPAGLRRLDAAHASLTITGFSPRELIHPDHDRPISLRECARLQTFPDGHDFQGGFQSVAQQIGNAVPPVAASVLAQWMLDCDGRCGAQVGTIGAAARPGLQGYLLTEASGMSPALQTTDARLRAMVGASIQAATMPAPPQQPNLFSTEQEQRLNLEDRKLITASRTLKPLVLSDRELARLVSVALHDLGHDDLIPSWVGQAPGATYFDVPLAWFSQDDQRPFDFPGFFSRCLGRVDQFRTIFRCLCALHTRRRKFEIILRNQPIPTMDQVAPRGLLEHGIVGLPGLTAWLMWRKWVYDTDNRSAQETGYLFEPMLAASLGGQTYTSRKSPVTRDGVKGGAGRQVDCILHADDGRFAYEFKARMTIAASGQGRFAEELSFPRDAAASGYTPVLLVMDPTPSDKLTQLVAAFKAAGGRSFIGEEVWEHLRAKSGEEIARFVTTYIREPIMSIAEHEERLVDLGMRYRTGSAGDFIEISLGAQTWTIPRPPRALAQGIDDLSDFGAGGDADPE